MISLCYFHCGGRQTSPKMIRHTRTDQPTAGQYLTHAHSYITGQWQLWNEPLPTAWVIWLGGYVRYWSGRGFKPWEVKTWEVTWEVKTSCELPLRSRLVCLKSRIFSVRYLIAKTRPKHVPISAVSSCHISELTENPVPNQWKHILKR